MNKLLQKTKHISFYSETQWSCEFLIVWVNRVFLMLYEHIIDIERKNNILKQLPRVNKIGRVCVYVVFDVPVRTVTENEEQIHSKKKI